MIPPGEEYDTARYGDRPFPVVPVQYRDRAYNAARATTSTRSSTTPTNEGSTFNLFQEMSLGQLYPDGTVPSDGIGTADFDSYGPGFDFTRIEADSVTTCTGVTETTPVRRPARSAARSTPSGSPAASTTCPARPSTTASDANGSALTGALAGVGALQAIDSGCGPTGKLVYDAAAIADPEIDYSDYDTDKDGVVDFFMAVFAGCGGNGASPAPDVHVPTPATPRRTTTSGRTPRAWSSTTPTPRPGCPASPPTTSSRTSRASRSGTPTRTATEMTVTTGPDDLKVFVRVGPYNVNPETAIDAASVISHEYGHSLGLPDFYSTGSRETYGDWNLMATDKSHNIDAYGRQELGWVVPEVLDSSRTESGITDSKQDIDAITWQRPDGDAVHPRRGRGRRRARPELPDVRRQAARPDPAGPGRSSRPATRRPPVHTWWSRSGNDFGCAKDPGKGHNFDLNLAGPERRRPARRAPTLSLDFKSMWDIEWDYDYGFVLTSTDGGRGVRLQRVGERLHDLQHRPARPATPTRTPASSTTTTALTGTSGSYDAGTEAVDRKAGNYPDDDLPGRLLRHLRAGRRRVAGAAVQLRHRPGPGPAAAGSSTT